MLSPSITSMEILEAYLRVDDKTGSFPLARISSGDITHTFWKHEHTVKFDSIHGGFGSTPEILSYLNYINKSNSAESTTGLTYYDDNLTLEQCRRQYQGPIWHVVVSNTNIQFDMYPEHASHGSSPYMKLFIEGLGLDYDRVPGTKSDLTLSIRDARLINEAPHAQFTLPISWSPRSGHTTKNQSFYLQALMELDEASQFQLSFFLESGPIRLCIDHSIIAFLKSFFPSNIVNTNAPIYISKVDVSSLDLTLDYEPKDLNPGKLLHWSIWERLNLLTFKDSAIHLGHVLAVDMQSWNELGYKIMESWAPHFSSGHITPTLEKIVPLPVHSSTGNHDINLILLPKTGGEQINYTNEAIEEIMQRVSQLPPGTSVYLEPLVPLVGGSMDDIWAGSISSHGDKMADVTTVIAIIAQNPSDDDLNFSTLRAIPIVSL